MRVDVAEAAVRARAFDLLGLETTSVREEVAVEPLAELLLSRNLEAIAVVDAARHVTGLVTKASLLRASRASAGKSRRAPRRAGDVAAPVSHHIPENASVAYAISLMASEDLHEVPVVDAENRLVGMLTATDTLRWVARSLGFDIPDPTAEVDS
jgi:CBS domain-containing membrane protein